MVSRPRKGRVWDESETETTTDATQKHEPESGEFLRIQDVKHQSETTGAEEICTDHTVVT